ncbi:MAG: MFS transporter [Thermoguttaceae bacterium]
MKDARFPRPFWTANVIELLERGAYYAMASFLVIYLGDLGFGDYWPSTLNGVLWTLIYFLPILSGTLADQIGFRKSLLAAMVFLAAGYWLIGMPDWLHWTSASPKGAEHVTASPQALTSIVLGILLVGLGGSFVKPCVSGTVQKTSLGRATLGFAIFYVVVNIGSLFGRGFGYVVRTRTTLSGIFAVSVACSIAALLVVLFLHRDPKAETAGLPQKPRRSIGQILLDMVLVLRDVRFALFLLVSSGFWFLYSQVYNVLPLYIKKTVELNPAIDLYTMANPLVIVTCQLLVTRWFGKMKPIRSIIVGIVIIGISMLINLYPLYAACGPQGVIACNLGVCQMAIPLASLLIILTVALIAVGELFTAARMYEYIGALAPKGQEGLYLGYANLPTAIGALIGGPVGAAIFNEIMCRDAVRQSNGLLQLDPAMASAGWLLLMGIGFASAAGMWLYNRWLESTAEK